MSKMSHLCDVGIVEDKIQKIRQLGPTALDMKKLEIMLIPFNQAKEMKNLMN